MTEKSLTAGGLGEQAASDFLRKQGWIIIQKNYRLKLGEIDIIAEDGDNLVFVEVKNYRADSLVNPLEAITYRKQGKLQRAAAVYLASRSIAAKNFRFDVVVVRHNKDNTLISCELFKNVF